MTPQKPYEATGIFAGGSEALLVTPIGANLFRLEESSIVDDVRYHDVIEAELQTDGALRFVRLMSRSELKTSCYVLPKTLIDSPHLSVFFDRVMVLGGNWETIFGGFLVLHLPAAEESSLLDELNTLIRESSRGNDI